MEKVLIRPFDSMASVTPSDEGYRIFREYYPKVTSWDLLKAAIRLHLLAFKRSPSLPRVEVILDAVNQEKLSRARKLLAPEVSYLVHVPDLSTERSRIFFNNMVARGERPVFYQSWGFGILPGVFREILSLSQGAGDWLGRALYFTRLRADLLHYRDLLRQTGAKTIITANEDSWNAPALAVLFRELGVRNINVMHGRVYGAHQFYDVSAVFGKACFEEVCGLASPETRVVQLPLLPEGGYRNSPRGAARSKHIIFFDQPASERVYPKHLRDKVISFLRLLSKKGFEVTLKLHPADPSGSGGTEGLKCIRILEETSLGGDHGIAISVCSTVALEVIPAGIPILYLNLDGIMTHFTQIRFLASVAASSLEEAEAILQKLQSADAYCHYRDLQQRLMQEEYSSAQGTISF